MARTIYALLVGINAYQPPVRPLNGCVNDIQRVQDLLRERVSAGDRFEPLLLTDDQATRPRIIDAFRSHLGQAGEDDVAFFYYSGHGSQAPSPPEFWHLEPDRLDETLVCYDSRSPGGWDLADKELAQLIAEVAEKKAHTLVILDCCHSGSGTRAPETEETVRRVPTDDRQRPLDTFVVSPEAATSLMGDGSRSVETGSGWTLLPRGRHVVFSACRAEEEAKELYIGGEVCGVFSYFLLETLQRSGQRLTYRDLFKRINALVRGKVSRQTPLLEAVETADLDQPFLGGAIAPRPAYFTLSHDQDLGWSIDGGAVHGIPAPQGDETTYLALFAIDTALDGLTSLAGAVGEARVTSTLAHASRVEVSLRNGQPDPGQTYRAVITALPLSPLQVVIEGEGEAAARVRSALAVAGPDQTPSLLLAEAGQASAAEVRLLAHEGGYRIVRTGDSYPLAVDVAGSNEAAATLAVARLEHIARWLRLYNLDNTASRLSPGDVRMQIYHVQPDGSLSELTGSEGAVRIEYEYRDGKWHEPQFKIKLTNQSRQRLYCALLNLSARYDVFTGLLAGSGVWLAPGEETWVLGGEPIYGVVEKELWEQGVVETHDLLKLIVSSDEFDATLMEQEALPVTPEQAKSAGTMRPLLHMNTLNRLMARVGTRAVRPRPEEAEDYVDWMTDGFDLIIVRPQEAVDVAGEGRSVPLGSGVTLQGHASLKAKARLTSLAETGRSLGNLTLPPLLRQDPATSQPFQFSASRSGEPGLSVLELFDVEDHEAVTPAQPLVLQAAVPLAAGEHVLPVAFDGEFFLPLGVVQPEESGVTIRLDRLPAPTVDGGKRDLKGSIRILFQKIVGERLGIASAYPMLAAAELAEDGSLVVEADLEAVRTRVAAAERIVLVVHGIIGDTRGMALAALGRLAGAEASPALVLSFDYENINTAIEETAQALKERLAAVGLGPGHGKQLALVAHSMGGLVSRWFIEQEGGNEVVQHLIMCGTPNGGSPWPSIQAWATTTLGIGLNSLGAVAWPVRALGGLLGAIEAVDVTLDQMHPGSAFLKTLAESPDPGLPYTVLAGNTSLIPAALQPDEGAQSPLARLLARLSPQTLLHGATALAFFGQPNDIAVSVESIRRVPADRSPQATVVEVACDHLTYFSSAAGVDVLATYLVST